MTAVPQWLLEQSTRVRDTEVSLPVVLGVGPVWPHPAGPGAWYAFITVASFPDRLWECDHLHAQQAEAWVCAGRRLLAARVLADHTYQPDVEEAL